MTLIPPVRAELAERFVFNFRMPLAALAEILPAPWLSPLPVRGYGVASFCLLDLRHIRAAPLPTLLGLDSVSCAPRYAVLDHSGGTPQPAVFVTERRTSSAFGSWFTGLGFSCHHAYTRARIAHGAGCAAIEADGADDGFRFGATVRAAGQSSSRPPSALFASPTDFGAFIGEGVTSYGLSRHAGRLTRVDLHKEDRDYEPWDVLTLRSPLVDGWRARGAVLDSAFRTSGGRYEWTYHGLRAAA